MSQLQNLFDVAQHELGCIRAGKATLTGLPSGVGLERLVPGGIPKKLVTAVYSDEGSFKTTLCAQMMYSMAAAGHTVLNVTLEDSAALVAHRYLARLSGVSYGRIHGGVTNAEETAIVARTQLSEAASRVFIVDDIEARWDRVVAAVDAVPGLDCLVVDYLQMFGRDPTVLDSVVYGAQALAKERNIAIILVSQRTKVEKDDANPRPKTANMFGSSAIRFGVKLAIGVFRPWMHCPLPSSPKGPYGPYCRFISANPAHLEVYPNILEVHVTKSLLGPMGAMWVRVYPETGIIEPFELGQYL